MGDTEQETYKRLREAYAERVNCGYTKSFLRYCLEVGAMKNEKVNGNK